MLSFQLPGMQAGWLLPWALTPSAILQDNLAQADKQTPSSVQWGTLIRPIPTIINSKVMDCNQHNLRLMSLMGATMYIYHRSRLKKMLFKKILDWRQHVKLDAKL